METIKLKTGRELKIKDISLDEKDDLIDGLVECENIYGKDGKLIGVKSMMKTMTKWLRTCLNGQATDEFIIGLSLEEKTEFFTTMKEKLILGEGNASNSN